jgi:chorismate mutase
MISVDLNLIAAQLEGLEETIIARLIDRAQFKQNAAAYEPGKSGFDGAGNETLFNIRLRSHEEMDSMFGRFCVPEERPFTSNLPAPRRSVKLPPLPLSIDDFDRVNSTGEIRPAYLDLLASLCTEGDDGQHGSSVEHDVHALQAISRRIHYGSFYVAESKYRANPAAFDKYISSREINGILELLTRPEVEKKIIDRIEAKVETIQAAANRSIRKLVDPGVISGFYRSSIIPITKAGEVRYMLNRKAGIS